MIDTLMGFGLSKNGLFWSLLIMLIVSVASLVPIVYVLVKLPATYFQEDLRSEFTSIGYHPALRWLIWLARNVIGLILIVVGVFLSLPGIPGQGLLIILMGVMVLDLPGKRWLERKVVARPSVLRVINRLRNRFGKPPLVLGGKLEKANEHDDSTVN